MDCVSKLVRTARILSLWAAICCVYISTALGAYPATPELNPKNDARLRQLAEQQAEGIYQAMFTKPHGYHLGPNPGKRLQYQFYHFTTQDRRILDRYLVKALLNHPFLGQQIILGKRTLNNYLTLLEAHAAQALPKPKRIPNLTEEYRLFQIKMKTTEKPLTEIEKQSRLRQKIAATFPGVQNPEQDPQLREAVRNLERQIEFESAQRKSSSPQRLLQQWAQDQKKILEKARHERAVLIFDAIDGELTRLGKFDPKVVLIPPDLRDQTKRNLLTDVKLLDDNEIKLIYADQTEMIVHAKPFFDAPSYVHNDLAKTIVYKMDAENLQITQSLLDLSNIAKNPTKPPVFKQVSIGFKPAELAIQVNPDIGPDGYRFPALADSLEWSAYSSDTNGIADKRYHWSNLNEAPYSATSTRLYQERLTSAEKAALQTDKSISFKLQALEESNGETHAVLIPKLKSTDLEQLEANPGRPHPGIEQFEVRRHGNNHEQPIFFREASAPDLWKSRAQPVIGVAELTLDDPNLITVLSHKENGVLIPHKGVVGVSTPTHSQLKSIVVLDAKTGIALEQGSDFHLVKSPSGGNYAIEFLDTHRKEGILIQTQFAPRPASQEMILAEPILNHLDSARLHTLNQELHEVGFSRLAEALEKEISNATQNHRAVSTDDIATVFRNELNYTYTKIGTIPPDWQKTKRTTRFTEYLGFLDDRGVVCLQCMPSNGFFSKYMNALFKDNPRIEFKIQVGHLVGPKEKAIASHQLHANTEVIVDGMQVKVLDATPGKFDPETIKGMNKNKLVAIRENLKKFWRGLFEKSKTQVASQSIDALVEKAVNLTLSQADRQASKKESEKLAAVRIQSGLEKMNAESKAVDISEALQKKNQHFEDVIKTMNIKIGSDPTNPILRLRSFKKVTQGLLSGELTSEQAAHMLEAVGLEAPHDRRALLEFIESELQKLRTRLNSKLLKNSIYAWTQQPEFKDAAQELSQEISNGLKAIHIPCLEKYLQTLKK